LTYKSISAIYQVVKRKFLSRSLSLDLVFVCPACRNALKDGPADVVCSRCAKRYEKVDGIPVFALKRENYWGWIPRDVVERVRDQSAVGDWDETMRAVVADAPGVLPHILRRSTDEARAAGKLLLSLTPQSRVLDIGCGLGAFAFSFARTCNQVVALDLILEHLQWIRAYAASLGLTNLVLGCAGDAPNLPFADHTFDVVLMSGVLEYVALACPGEPSAVQQAFLRDIARILKPDGQVYIGIENRLSWRYFLGRREEHTKMRFAALLPRLMANAIHRRTRGREFRIYTYSMRGYRRLL
jgi:SAM-dependent methyltransferase